MTCPRCETNHRPNSRHDDCEVLDLLARAFMTGRIHAQRGARCAVDIALDRFGPKVADAYARGYDYEVAR